MYLLCVTYKINWKCFQQFLNLFTYVRTVVVCLTSNIWPLRFPLLGMNATVGQYGMLDIMFDDRFKNKVMCCDDCEVQCSASLQYSFELYLQQSDISILPTTKQSTGHDLFYSASSCKSIFSPTPYRSEEYKNTTASMWNWISQFSWKQRVQDALKKKYRESQIYIYIYTYTQN